MYHDVSHHYIPYIFSFQWKPVNKILGMKMKNTIREETETRKMSRLKLIQPLEN